MNKIKENLLLPDLLTLYLEAVDSNWRAQRILILHIKMLIF